MDLSVFQNPTRGAFAAALLACACAACTPNPNGMGVADFGSVTGTVSDRLSGQPIPNALISIGSLVTRTGADGGFTLANVPVGTQTILVSAIGWQSFQETLSVTKDQNVGIQVQLASSIGG